MATLSQALNNNKQKTQVRGPGGQLTEQAPEEIQNLAGQAGLQAPPTTAIGAGMLGANADQQKMMGTPAQKQAALSLALQPPEQGLAGALRRQQSRTTLTGEEQEKQQKNTDMENLGNLGDRVTQFIDTQRQLLQEQEAPVDVQAVDQFQGRDVSTLKQNLAALRADPNNMQLQLEVNKALGRNINSTLSPDEINKLYESATDSIARGTAGNVDNDLTVSDLIESEQFGYDLPTLSNLLGIPQDRIASLNVGQLRSEINRVGDEEFQKTQELEQQAQSGKLGIAERAAALQAQREQSTTGIRATEADYSNLEQQISNADQVTFGGKQYGIDDLLRDETISGIVKEYMDSPEGSEVRQRIDSTEPGLKAFIDRNRNVLAEAAQKLGGAATEFTGIQEANKQIGKVGSSEVSEKILKDVVPGFGELQASKTDPNSIPVLAAVRRSSNPDASVNALNVAENKEPGVAKQINALPQEKANDLMDNNAIRLTRYVEDADQYRRAKNAADSGNINAIVQYAVNGMDASTLLQESKDTYTRHLLGVPRADDTMLSLGRAKGDPSAVAGWLVNNVINRNGQPDLSKAADGADQSLNKIRVGINPPLGGVQADAYGKLSSLATGPGSISFDSASSKASMYDMQRYIDAGVTNGEGFSRDFANKFKQKQQQNIAPFQADIDKTNQIAAQLNYLKATGDTTVLDAISPPDPMNDAFPWQRDQRVFAKTQEAITGLEQQRDKFNSMLNDPAQVAQYGRENIEQKLRDGQQKMELAIAIKDWYSGYYNDKYSSGYSPSASKRSK